MRRMAKKMSKRLKPTEKVANVMLKKSTTSRKKLILETSNQLKEAERMKKKRLNRLILVLSQSYNSS